MEILYIYIHNYKKIQKQNINFGGKYRFHYDHESKELTVSENHQHIEGFYDKHSEKKDFARITNVTSIIGENGVGKTTILDFIYENFREGTYVSTPFICALKKFEKLEVHYYEIEVTHNGLINLNIFKKHEKEGLGLFSDISSNKNLFNLLSFYEQLPKTSFIRFSNIFDNSEPSLLSNEIYNISTNYLVKNDSLKRSLQFENYIEFDAVDIFRFEEVFRQSKFISNCFNSGDRIPFVLPNSVNIKMLDPAFEKGNLNYHIHSLVGHKFKPNAFFYAIKVLFEKIEEYRNKKDFEIDTIISNAIVTLWLKDSYLSLLLGVKTSKSENEFWLDLKINELGQKDILVHVENLFNRYKEKIPTLLGERIVNLNKFYDFLLEYNSYFTFTHHMKSGKNEISAIFHWGEKNDLFHGFIKLYSVTFISIPYLSLNWRNLSSGEQAIFNIYSRFFTLSDTQNRDNPLNDNLIILMDEPDTNLHPQWQKTLLNSLLDFLPEIYARKDADGKKVKQRNIQIIFTTNNPISASDMLASNTIFMKLNKNVRKESKKKDGTIEIIYEDEPEIQDSLTDQRQTFGANIYSLYADSFFIQDGLMGKFASEKINAIIKNLNSLKPLNAKERETMRKTILQIGEPAIKNKLIQMYSDRYNLDIHERLEILENKFKKDDQDTPE